MHAIAPAAERAGWDFASEKSPWRPTAQTVAVERVQAEGWDGKLVPCLRIHGEMKGGWNYAGSPSMPITPGQAYHLTAWLRVERVGPATPMPFLKCEFRSETPGQDLGRMRTDPYEPAQAGKWQRLDGEFVPPAAAKSCWVALEKGTDRPTQIDAYLAAVRLEPIPRLTQLSTYRLDPLPAPLAKMRGVHPRMYLTRERVAELRTAIQATHAGIWNKVQGQADVAVGKGPPAYRVHDTSSGDEQLWQRGVGNTMPALAMAYALTGRREYLTAACQWALAACRYPTWGLNGRDGMDLAAGHLLFGLGLVYDWCYADLDEAARREIRETLTKRASAMYRAAAMGKVGWHQSYLQNHLWVNASGLAVAGLALFDEVPEAADWVGLARDKFRRTMDALGPDGASHEGVGYWEYGVEYLLKFADLGDRLLDVDLASGPWWRNTAAYGHYLMLPRNSWRSNNCIVDVADCPRHHWYGPEYLLRNLAARFRDPHAQWLAAEAERAGVCSTGATWLNLLWFDPTLQGKPPTGLPFLRHFEDLGIVSARTDWSGDEALLVFKCGPPLGHAASAKFSHDPGSGHAHPDANHFVLFGLGEWLLRDDGYHPKFAGQHNTLLVDGQGQLGEGEMWLRGAVTLGQAAPARILRAESSPELDHLVGDATGAYPKQLGLQRFVRHLLFAKPDVLIVADEIVVNQEMPLELRFHPEQAPRREGSEFVAEGKKAVLRMVPLTPDGVTLASETLPLPGGDGHTSGDIPTIRLRTHRAAWRNAVAFSWSSSPGQPAKVELRSQEERQWVFAIGQRRVGLAWGVFDATPSRKAP